MSLVPTSGRSVSPFFRDIGSTITSVKLQYCASTLCELITKTKNKNSLRKHSTQSICFGSFWEAFGFVFVLRSSFVDLFSPTKWTRVARASTINATLSLYRTSRAFCNTHAKDIRSLLYLWYWTVDFVKSSLFGKVCENVDKTPFFWQHSWEGFLRLFDMLSTLQNVIIRDT